MKGGIGRWGRVGWVEGEIALRSFLRSLICVLSSPFLPKLRKKVLSSVACVFATSSSRSAIPRCRPDFWWG